MRHLVFCSLNFTGRLRLSPSFVCKLWSRFAGKCAWSVWSARVGVSGGVGGDGSLEAEREVSFGDCTQGWI